MPESNVNWQTRGRANLLELEALDNAVGRRATGPSDADRTTLMRARVRVDAEAEPAGRDRARAALGRGKYARHH